MVASISRLSCERIKVSPLDDSIPAGRVRDVLPVPLLNLAIVSDLVRGSEHELFGDLMLVMLVANLTLQGLNVLMGHQVGTHELGRCGPQRAVQLRSIRKASRWCKQMHGEQPPDGRLAWARLIADEEVLGVKGRPTLEAFGRR